MNIRDSSEKTSVKSIDINPRNNDIYIQMTEDYQHHEHYERSTDSEWPRSALSVY